MARLASGKPGVGLSRWWRSPGRHYGEIADSGGWRVVGEGDHESAFDVRRVVIRDEVRLRRLRELYTVGESALVSTVQAHVGWSLCGRVLSCGLMRRVEAVVSGKRRESAGPCGARDQGEGAGERPWSPPRTVDSGRYR